MSRNKFILSFSIENSKQTNVFRNRRPPSAPATSSWAGRVTVPEPFALTKSSVMRNVHRRKCMHELQESKIKKEIDEELAMKRQFKGKSRTKADV